MGEDFYVKEIFRRFIVLAFICTCTMIMNSESAYARDIYAGEFDGKSVYVVEETVSTGDQKYSSKVKVLDNATGEYGICYVRIKMSRGSYVCSIDNGPFEVFYPGDIEYDILRVYQRIGNSVGTAP